MSSSKTALIPAVAYLRKSTKGDRNGREKQEHSIEQQKAEIVKLAKREGYDILDEFEDDGISGWKRGAKRPDFQKMILGAKELGAQAILCDNLDRFSRATYDDVQEDTRELRKAGVRWIVTASHGDYDLGHRNDIAEIIKFAAAVWAAHEYSRNLGRRIARARRDKAIEGKRTGGNAPYAMANDGKGGLIHGDPKQVRTLRWIFDQCANNPKMTVNKIVGDLNTRNPPLPSPAGKEWWVKTVTDMLRNRVYRGDFVYGQSRGGQFFSHDDKGEVVDVADLFIPDPKDPKKLIEIKGKQYKHEDRYTALIDTETFDKVQRRLDRVNKDRSQRKREGYALTGILVCGHCGTNCYGTTMHGNTIYRCNAASIHGKGACPVGGNQQVREDALLPVLMKILGEEIAELKKLREMEERTPETKRRKRFDKVDDLEQEKAKLNKQIENLVTACADSSDPFVHSRLFERIARSRERGKEIEAELAKCGPETGGYKKEECEALQKWWDDFQAKAVKIPLRPEHRDVVVFNGWEGLDEESKATARELLDPVDYIEVDPLKVNEALDQIKCKVTLYWETEPVPKKAGGTMTRYKFKRGCLQLGQQKKGDLQLSIGLVNPGPPAAT